MKSLYAIAGAMVLFLEAAQAQTPEGAPVPARPALLRHAVSVTAGMISPLTRPGIREFWRPGPAGSVSFSVAANRHVFLGLGVEAARFRFNASRFSESFPGVAAGKDDIYWVSVTVGARVALLPGMRTSPYLSGAVGASRMTEALNRVVEDRTRITYYDVGGTTRLTAAAAVGTDIFLTRAFAFEFEVRGISVHNDPDLGFSLSAHAGLHLAF